MPLLARDRTDLLEAAAAVLVAGGVQDGLVGVRLALARLSPQTPHKPCSRRSSHWRGVPCSRRRLAAACASSAVRGIGAKRSIWPGRWLHHSGSCGSMPATDSASVNITMIGRAIWWSFLFAGGLCLLLQLFDKDGFDCALDQVADPEAALVQAGDVADSSDM